MPQDIREQEPEQSHVFSWLSAAWRFPSVDEVLLLARVDVSLIRGTSPRAETLPPPPYSLQQKPGVIPRCSVTGVHCLTRGGQPTGLVRGAPWGCGRTLEHPQHGTHPWS